MNQDVLGEAMEGASQTTVSDYELGKAVPSLGRLRLAADLAADGRAVYAWLVGGGTTPPILPISSAGIRSEVEATLDAAHDVIRPYIEGGKDVPWRLCLEWLTRLAIAAEAGDAAAAIRRYRAGRQERPSDTTDAAAGGG